MSHYEVVRYEVRPVEGDTQVEVVIHASDGNKWEYGIPYSASGRYQAASLSASFCALACARRGRSGSCCCEISPVTMEPTTLAPIVSAAILMLLLGW